MKGKNKDAPAVLIVSSWATIRNLVKLALESSDFIPVEVESIPQAREVLAHGSAELMIVDTDVVFDGSLVEVTKRNESVPLLLLEENGHRTRVRGHSQAVRLCKPFTKGNLLLAIEIALLLSQETDDFRTYFPNTKVKGKRQITRGNIHWKSKNP